MINNIPLSEKEHSKDVFRKKGIEMNDNFFFAFEIKQALKDFKEELDKSLNKDDEYMGIDLVTQRWVFEIMPMFKKHFGSLADD